MANILRIETIIEPKIGLTAFYRDTAYPYRLMTSIVPVSEPLLTVEFCRKEEVEGLNAILLTTGGRGDYAVHGIARFDRGDGHPELYDMGPDLEVMVDENSEKLFAYRLSLVRIFTQNPDWN